MKSMKRRLRNIVEDAIESNPKLKEVSVRTFRSDAAAILESLVGEFEGDRIEEAMDRQGFKGEAYQPAIRVLKRIARSRRSLRNRSTVQSE
jgi:hypothetical protein